MDKQRREAGAQAQSWALNSVSRGGKEWTYLGVTHQSVDNVVDTAFDGKEVVQTDANLGI